MRPLWPALTRFYGLKPWEVDLLTSGEVDEYIDWYGDYMDAVEQAREVTA